MRPGGCFQRGKLSDLPEHLSDLFFPPAKSWNSAWYCSSFLSFLSSSFLWEVTGWIQTTANSQICCSSTIFSSLKSWNWSFTPRKEPLPKVELEFFCLLICGCHWNESGTILCHPSERSIRIYRIPCRPPHLWNQLPQPLLIKGEENTPKSPPKFRNAAPDPRGRSSFPPASASFWAQTALPKVKRRDSSTEIAQQRD